MQYLLDTANLEEIKKYTEIFPITGVTSNPSIVKNEGKIDFFAHMKEIRSIIGFEQSLHIQVTALDFDGMMKDADTILEKVDKEVYIKVPVTLAGIQVIKALKARGNNVTATAIYSKAQGFLAMEAGADYIAPYYNRMENMNVDPEDAIAAFADMIDMYGYSTKVLAASFKNAGQIDKAFMAGAQAATLQPDIMVAALKQATILDAVDAFNNDWESIYGDKRIYEL
ncbi:fructose-6-phosphate aldolase [Chakrabartyella piscis]|uniref:fructose-6-phosphate aldolase n=1 Tax=Chakrabartyella piscis TaxID=2918914 RepID=UPI0029588C59|nr:fructose-6-phosphate aldolase [Chakrabartyella piscis]